MAHIAITPADDLIDVPRRILIGGVQTDALIELRTRTARGDAIWTSRAVFRADAHGVIDLSRDAPIEGDYSDVSPMGLIWSQAPVEAGTREVFPADVRDALITHIEVFDSNANRLIEGVLTQRLIASGVQRREMREDGCVGTPAWPAGPDWAWPGAARWPTTVPARSSPPSRPPSAASVGPRRRPRPAPSWPTATSTPSS